jgi:ABC-type nitrate/sulfonate/bicarbonate transport system substrate-binding protein
MTRILIVLAALAVLATTGGCAATPAKTTMGNGWRSDTDYSAYRTIPAAIQCDDCRYE